MLSVKKFGLKKITVQFVLRLKNDNVALKKIGTKDRSLQLLLYFLLTLKAPRKNASENVVC